MGKEAVSKIAKTAEENKKFLEETSQMLRERRERGDETNYTKKNKDKGKKFNFLRYLTTRNDKIGRYGAKRAAERNDIIGSMGKTDIDTSGAYFDPLSLKVIIPKTVEYLGSDNKEMADADVSQAHEIEDAFYERVVDEIDLAKSNDFEADRNDLDARLALAESNETNKGKGQGNSFLSNQADKYDAGRSFIPDEKIIEEIPDAFSLEIGVGEPPQEHALEWELFKADQTKSFSARVKGIFRKIFKVKTPTENEMFLSFAKKLPEYKRIDGEGKREAQEARIKYDPKLNNRLSNYVSDLYEKLKTLQNGHSYVRLIAHRGGTELSAYSFMFAVHSGTSGGMEGVITGVVANPAKKYDDKVTTREKIPYQNYLKAAARIRGLAGSMRSYSYLGYNCTSFAAEIAETAGVKFDKKDTSALLMSHRHREQRVDNPFRLAAFIKKREEKIVKENKSNETDTDEQSKVLGSEFDDRKLSYDMKYTDQFMNLEIVQQIVNSGRKDKSTIKYLFRDFMNYVLREGLRIDNEYPLAGSEDQEIGNNAVKRENAKLKIFGRKSEEELFEHLVNPANPNNVVRLIFGSGYKTVLDNLPKNTTGQNDAKTKGTDRKTVKRNVDNPSEKLTHSKIQKWMKSDVAANIDEVREAFLATYKKPLGIEGYSRNSGGRIKSYMDFARYLDACNSNPLLQDVIRESYVRTSQVKNDDEIVQIMKELFETILTTVGKDSLLEIMKTAGLE